MSRYIENQLTIYHRRALKSSRADDLSTDNHSANRITIDANE